MKKTYINPELEVIKIATQQMLAISGDGEVNIDTTPVDPSTGDAPEIGTLIEFDIIN